jgi:hypothetical protein
MAEKEGIPEEAKKRLLELKEDLAKTAMDLKQPSTQERTDLLFEMLDEKQQRRRFEFGLLAVGTLVWGFGDWLGILFH